MSPHKINKPHRLNIVFLASQQVSEEGIVEDAVPVGPSSCYGVPATSLIGGSLQDLVTLIDPMFGPPDRGDEDAKAINGQVLEEMLQIAETAQVTKVL